MDSFPLCVDIGNSNICVASHAGERIFRRCESDPTKSKRYFTKWLKEEVAPYCGKPDGAIIASVVPALTSKLSGAIKAAFGINAIALCPDTKTGLVIKIKNPRELGADLAASAVGAKVGYPLPAVVVDLGTATKFTIVNDEGEYIGGAILPGIKTSFKALIQKAALLRDFRFTPPVSPIGTDTPEALNAGAVYGTASLIDGMCRRYEDALGTRPNVILTGGLAPLVSEYCEYPMTRDEWIIMDGLRHIFELNAQKEEK